MRVWFKGNNVSFFPAFCGHKNAVDAVVGTYVDGRIAALKLTAMQDDKNFFPNYNPALTVRQEVFDKYPQLADLMAAVAARLDNETMQKLNAQVDVDGKDPADVATDWLKSGRYELEVASERLPAEIHLAPLYDPAMARIKS